MGQLSSEMSALPSFLRPTAADCEAVDGTARKRDKVAPSFAPAPNLPNQGQPTHDPPRQPSNPPAPLPVPSPGQGTSPGQGISPGQGRPPRPRTNPDAHSRTPRLAHPSRF
ncbi:hypothetical protein TWF730_005534 [Orbilia blumenaviensis]|uniref:Uncharacterized protein n=1 Tax=Orbilia blumenaviensis TaxID=1796055 RepID=A0AAV9VIW3_9PEZI